jgi:hypothetical protein
MANYGVFLRSRFYIQAFAMVLVGILALSLPSGGQDLQSESVPLPLPSMEALPNLEFLPEGLDTTGKGIPPQTSIPQNNSQGQINGTSDDRIFWTIPNFLTLENAGKIPPFTPGQKFKVVARGVFDPFEFVLVGFVAGLGQANDSNPPYAQGAQGYTKQYGTSYADNAIENFIAGAVFPTLLHQDPRYCQLGHGWFLQRSAHAVSRVIITRSDSGHTQFNYSEMFGGVSAAAISTYTYHPQVEHNAAM